MILTTQQYRYITGDWITYDGDVEGSLHNAQKYVEDYTGRTFEYGEYTEELIPNEFNTAYPKAVPIESITSLPDGSVAPWTLWSPYTVYMYPLVNTYTYTPSIYPVPNYSYFGTPITYTGGYKPEDMPIDIMYLVAEIALFNMYGINRANANMSPANNSSSSSTTTTAPGSTSSTAPPGIKSVSVSGLSVTFDTATVAAAATAKSSTGGIKFDQATLLPTYIVDKLNNWKKRL